MQIAFFDLEEWQADYLQAGLQQLGLAEQVQAHYSTEHLTLEDCARYAACEAIAVFVWTKITRPILDALPQLRLILTMSTGYDHIDLDACRERKIVVCNVPHYGENTVAEHTFALILSLSRACVRCQNGWRTRRAVWRSCAASISMARRWVSSGQAISGCM